MYGKLFINISIYIAFPTAYFGEIFKEHSLMYCYVCLALSGENEFHLFSENNYFSLSYRNVGLKFYRKQMFLL